MTRSETHELDPEERRVAAALSAERLDPLDFVQVARGAERRGTRTRRLQRTTAAVVVVAVGSLGLGIASRVVDAGGVTAQEVPAPYAAASGSVAPREPAPMPEDTTARCPRRLGTLEGDGRAVPSALEADCGPSPDRGPLDLDEAYATLEVDAWSVPDDNVIADEKLYYLGDGDRSVLLNWRPASTYSAKWFTDEESTAMIDGDPAWVLRKGDGLTVAGPVREGRFLTLASTTLSEGELVRLAAFVRRQ